MANVTPLTLIVVIVAMTFIMPYLSGISAEYAGNATYTASMVSLNYSISNTYTNRVLTPLIGNPASSNASGSIIANGIGYSSPSQMASASSQFGFAFAFIIPGLINILLNLLCVPEMIGQCVGSLLVFIPASNLQTTVIAAQITGLGWIFLGLLFVSAYLKYPMV